MLASPYPVQKLRFDATDTRCSTRRSEYPTHSPSPPSAGFFAHTRDRADDQAGVATQQTAMDASSARPAQVESGCCQVNAGPVASHDREIHGIAAFNTHERRQMQLHIGTKQVTATPMTRLAYNEYRNWNLPENENGSDDGYLVEYLDGGKVNHPGHTGYISWSPKAQFDAAYRPTNGMSFGLAIEALKAGECVARAGWNGKGMWLFIIQGSNDIAKLNGYGFGELLGEPTFRDAIFMKTVDNQLVAWTASQTDMLADDWKMVE